MILTMKEFDQSEIKYKELKLFNQYFVSFRKNILTKITALLRLWQWAMAKFVAPKVKKLNC